MWGSYPLCSDGAVTFNVSHTVRTSGAIFLPPKRIVNGDEEELRKQNLLVIPSEPTWVHMKRLLAANVLSFGDVDRDQALDATKGVRRTFSRPNGVASKKMVRKGNRKGDLGLHKAKKRKVNEDSSRGKRSLSEENRQLGEFLFPLPQAQAKGSTPELVELKLFIERTFAQIQVSPTSIVLLLLLLV